MVRKSDSDRMYMKMAFEAAALSHARRLKVGAILVVPEQGRFEGINGMPSGFDNNCEIEFITKPEVLHAEANAISKVARSTSSSIGSTMYCTASPCVECAKLMIQVGVVRVVYANQYRLPDGIDLLRRAKIQVDYLPLESHNVVEDELTLQDEGRHRDEEDGWRY